MRKLPEGAQVSLEMTGETGQMLLRSGRSRFLLQSLPASDFPDLTAGEFSHRFTLPAVELKRLIDNTQFAISTEETRYYLNGIFFHTVDVGGATMLRAVATDGHRLARVETPAPAGAAGMPGVIAPRKAVNEVQKLLEDMAQEIVDRDLADQGAVPVRRRQADDQADRRHVSRLQSRHPDPQRQAARRRQGAVPDARSTASRRFPPSAGARSSSRSPTTR